MLSNDEKRFLDKLGHKIADVRKKRGVTQEKLAELSGLDRVAIANIETGRRRPTVTTLYKMAKALQVDISLFFK